MRNMFLRKKKMPFIERSLKKIKEEEKQKTSKRE
jgi:hypothetical protein